MPTYTYYSFALTTGAIISEVPLVGARPTWTVNDAGDLGGPTINLSDLTDVQLQDIRAGTVPWKTGIAVDRDNVIIWSGIVTGRRYSSRSHAYSLTVPGLLAYWRRRILDSNLTWKGAEQFDIVIDLLQYGGDPTVPVIMTHDDSGMNRDRTVAGADFKNALDEILAIADNLNGYELTLDTAWDTTPGTQSVVHTLRIASPRLGVIDDGSGGLLSLEYPGNVREFTWDEDGDEFGTTVYGSSTDADGVVTTSTAVNATLLGQGFPQVGLTRQWDGITVTDTLVSHVAQALAEADGYQDAPTFLVPDEGDTAAGSWGVGDDIRIRITDDRRFPTPPGSLGPGLDRTVRLSSASVDPVAGTVALTMFAFTGAVQ